ncbi:MAG: ribonuclease P protein component [Lachnospiraceae bacterium]|nr:ribonuclease P protein component [Lachnospiraceae bacterium]MDY5741862.1 ribonuclease P protein component [Lachnospiraceae bacterium]
MKYSESLKKYKDFHRVYRKGKSFANKHLVMYVMKNSLTVNRIGISVSKKVGNSVVRHRITRLVREAYRLNEEAVAAGYDIVVIGREAAKDQSFAVIEQSLLHLYHLHGMKKC